jgi:hypothetical protein
MNIGEAYYKAVGEKNLEKAEQFLHPDVEMIGPLSKVSGKKEFVDAVKRFLDLFTTLTIRAKFDSENQAMIVYELNCPAPFGTFSAAVLLTIQDDLIKKFELIFDARPFVPELKRSL